MTAAMVIAVLLANARPPDPYVVDNLVPGGFEHYGAWTAKRPTPLVAAPGSRKQVATVEACEVVDAEKGELRGRPWALRLLRDAWGFHVGDRMWILARDLEEGYFELWVRGEIRDDLSVVIHPYTDGVRCGRPSEGCWLRFEKEPTQAFWVRMRTKDGVVGWTTRVEDFREATGTSGASICAVVGGRRAILRPRSPLAGDVSQPRRPRKDEGRCPSSVRPRGP